MRKTSSILITNQYWVSSSAWPKVMARAMAMFLAWAVVRARPIIRKILCQLCLQVLPCDNTDIGLAVFARLQCLSVITSIICTTFYNPYIDCCLFV